MNKKTLLNELLLLFGTMIWGIAFVFQSLGMKYVSPLTFNMERSLVASCSLFIVYIIVKLIKKRSNKKSIEEKKYKIKDLIIGSLVCGSSLSIAMLLQQFGISLESAGKSGFITALYIVFVPLFGLFFKKKPSLSILIGVALSIGGLLLINCIDGKFEFGLGSLLLIGCAIGYALQIIAVDQFSKKCNTILLTGGQFLVSFLIHFPLMFIFETPNINSMVQAWGPVLFLGILSSGVGFSIQVYTQKNISPAIASLIMSFEAVFSLLAGVIILKEKHGILELIGCILLFLAIIIAQIPISIKRKGMFRNPE